jgi:hypothetical protein
MKVDVLDYTKNAIELLIFCKGTRLDGNETVEDIIKWPYEKKIEHLNYMKDTIKSQFEFINFTFLLSGVSRAFTHQLVRTRTQSYSQQSMRAVDVRDSTIYHLGLCDEYDHAVSVSLESYAKMVDNGIPIQDARGVLPLDITTNIIVGTNLRVLHDTGKVRLCVRTAGEYQNVFKEMKKRVTEIYPELGDFIMVECVSSGICAFPRYTECPVQPTTVKIDNYRKLAIKIAWETTTHEANPIAKNGVTQ